VFAKGQALTSGSEEQNSPFRHDTRVSREQIKFICGAGQPYELYNQKPQLGTWKKISESTRLYPGMIFKVGTDLICEGIEKKKIKGFNFVQFWASCFKVIFMDADRYLYQPVSLKNSTQRLFCA